MDKYMVLSFIGEIESSVRHLKDTGPENYKQAALARLATLKELISTTPGGVSS